MSRSAAIMRLLATVALVLILNAIFWSGAVPFNDSIGPLVVPLVALLLSVGSSLVLGFAAAGLRDAFVQHGNRRQK